MHSYRKIRRKERGMIMALSLMLLVILMTMGFTLISTSVTQMKEAANQQKSTRAFYYADAGIRMALKKLSLNDTPDALHQAKLAPADPRYPGLTASLVLMTSLNPQAYAECAKYYMEEIDYSNKVYKIVSYGWNTDGTLRTILCLVRKSSIPISSYAMLLGQSDRWVDMDQNGNPIDRGSVSWSEREKIDLGENGRIFVNSAIKFENFNSTFQGSSTDPGFSKRVEASNISSDQVGKMTQIYDSEEQKLFDYFAQSVDFNRLRMLSQEVKPPFSPMLPCGSPGARYTPYYWSYSCVSRCGAILPFMAPGTYLPTASMRSNYYIGLRLEGSYMRNYTNSSYWTYRVNQGPASGQHYDVSNLPPNGVVFFDTDVHIKGTVQGKLTIVSTQKIYIDGDLIIANPDSMISVITQKQILLDPPDFSRGGHPDDLNNNRALDIDAVLVATEGDIQFNFNSPKNVRNGKLNITGAIYSKNSPVFSSRSGQGLPDVNIKYDERLQVMKPAQFPQIDSEKEKEIMAKKGLSEWDIIYWQDMSAMETVY